MKPRNKKESILSDKFNRVRKLARVDPCFRSEAKKLEHSMRKTSRQLDKDAIKTSLNEDSDAN